MNQRVHGLTHVAPVFRVADLARSLSFYCDQLGFELEFNYQGFYAGVQREGCHVHLKCTAPRGRDQAAFDAAEHIDASFGVHDAHLLASRFAAAGAHLSVPLRTMPYGTEFYVKDPDGYVLAFVQPLG